MEWLIFGAVMGAVALVSVMIWSFLWGLAAGFGNEKFPLKETVISTLITTSAVAVLYLAGMTVWKAWA